MSWRTALSLDVLLDEVNAAAPNRSKAADGSIGDTAHSSRTSDHNPNDAGVVRARDFTHDTDGGFDGHLFAERVRQLGLRGHPALGPGAYVISRGRIATATYGWVWRDYTGSNPHDHHTHVSVATAADGYDSTHPWGVVNQEDEVTPEDIDKIAAAAVAKLLATKIEVKRGGEGETKRLSVEQVLRETFQRS